jgi:hypothetical protein
MMGGNMGGTDREIAVPVLVLEVKGGGKAANTVVGEDHVESSWSSGRGHGEHVVTGEEVVVAREESTIVGEVAAVIGEEASLLLLGPDGGNLRWWLEIYEWELGRCLGREIEW